ncbi:MAG: tRNA delta(2)-isopentenylpyrophosphate transferase [Acidobacteriaceae bacterium]|nr:tRNA delta(2)-isopentenylpyrophosphate transferase [Acidobacteriaceae bacterium]
MTVPQENPILIVIVGATASGKTALSLALAEKFRGEIVSCDSVAVYREFEIGTAKPSQEDRKRVPHHLIDVADASAAGFTAGEYARLGRAAIQEINERSKTPIVVGGTGLYLRALLDGLFAGPQRSEELRARLRERVESKGAAYLHRVLRRMDPAAAASIHPNDVPKVIRAIEICQATREKMTDLWKQGRDPITGFRIVRLGLNPDRQLLYERINARCRQMFQDGLIAETGALAAKYPQTLTIPNSPINSLGYRQALQHINGELSLEEAITAAQQAHRNYAKRQMTWFRREHNIHWLAGFGNDPAVQSNTVEIVSKQM